ncbi:MAG: biotin/lipoyl-binding protein, partial [Oscillospiraceae bacterium]
MKSATKRVLACACAALLAGMTGCAKPAAPADAANAVLRVKTQAPTRGALVQTADYTGRVMPDQSVYVIPKVAGEVTDTYFEVGDPVKKGDVLFKIDDSGYQIGVRQATAAVEAVAATIALTKGSGYESQLLQADSALKQAQSGKKWTEDTYDIYDESFSDTVKLMRQKVDMAKTGMEDAKKAWQAATGEEEKNAAYQGYLAAQAGYQEADNAYDSYIGSYETQYNQLTQGLEQTEIGLDAAEKAYDLVSGGKALNEQLAIYDAQLLKPGNAQKALNIGAEPLGSKRLRLFFFNVNSVNHALSLLFKGG